MTDPHDLQRFVNAQEDVYADALAEIRRGRKTSHWMWYVFPQLLGLGSSSVAKKYAIRSRAEAEAYLQHPILGPRLQESMDAVLAVDDLSATEIFGYPDDLKLRSCATLFATVSAADSVFHRVIEKYFDRVPDELTLRLLQSP